MSMLNPVPGDIASLNCPHCGDCSAEYRVQTVSLGQGDALVHDALAGVCTECHRVLSLPNYRDDRLEIVRPDTSEQARGPRITDKVPARLTPEAAQELHRLALAGLPRLGVATIGDLTRLRKVVEDIAFAVDDVRRDSLRLNESNSWRMQHLLDDVQDVLDAVTAL